MSIKSDLKSVFEDLSSIVAGLKLALIVISYFGLGSVAKWVISHWYPFTRWVWDVFCKYFTLPVFPDVIKDSLTALVFFLPLAVTSAFEYRSRGAEKNNIKHRFFGAMFGILFLLIICKDVLSAIAKSISNATPLTQSNNFLVQFAINAVEKFDAIPVSFWVLLLAAYIIVALTSGLIIYRRPSKREHFEKIIRRLARIIFTGFVFISVGASSLVVTIANTGGLYRAENEILGSLAIMSVILSIIAAAVAFAPRKLFITAGVCIGFVLAAMCVELLMFVIHFIERAPEA